jgi:ATPase subunit of ABC transporter with duplicated ATPase domains
MPAISVFDLAWSTPDGHSVLSNLTLSFAQERTGIIGRNGVGKTSLLKLLAGEREPRAGKVVVSGTLAMLRQIVRVEPDDNIADLFGVADALHILRRAEAGMATADEMAGVDWMLEARIAAALARVGLDATPGTRLAVLSGGQRTRAAMAAAILNEPDFLLLDEPSNNLDAEGRHALLDLIGSWRKGAIIVSHDRALLDRMDAIVELTTLGATRYGGNWSRYREQKAVELAAARHDIEVAERQVGAAARAAQIAVERKRRRDATGRRNAGRGGIPRILIGARQERAENSGGSNARLADRLRAEASEAARIAHSRVETLETMVVALAPTGLTANRVVLALDRVTAGYDPAASVARDLSFTITGPERLAITGPNGSGKTTLLQVVAGLIPPLSGHVMRNTPFAMLDQSVSILDPGLSIVENFRSLNPGADDQTCRAALARFRFRADAALQRVGTLSGGETLRAGLACILGSPVPPPFLILDEPTNHLDLDSIATMEAGLCGFDGALMVASHDAVFLQAIGITRHISLGE